LTTNDEINAELDSYSCYGRITSGCGGGYIVLATEDDVPGGFRIRVRRQSTEIGKPSHSTVMSGVPTSLASAGRTEFPPILSRGDTFLAFEQDAHVLGVAEARQIGDAHKREVSLAEKLFHAS
jgi:hypothetical protein